MVPHSLSQPLSSWPIFDQECDKGCPILRHDCCSFESANCIVLNSNMCGWLTKGFFGNNRKSMIKRIDAKPPICYKMAYYWYNVVNMYCSSQGYTSAML